jgi:hypothetical protein
MFRFFFALNVFGDCLYDIKRKITNIFSNSDGWIRNIIRKIKTTTNEGYRKQIRLIENFLKIGLLVIQSTGKCT